MGPETHQDVLGLPGLDIVESLGVISSHRLELNIQLQASLVGPLGEILLGEAAVLHTADQPLPIVAGLRCELELLDLLHATVRPGLGWEVLHRAGVGILSQPPAELDSGSGSVRDTGHLQEGTVKYCRWQTGNLRLETKKLSRLQTINDSHLEEWLSVHLEQNQ